MEKEINFTIVRIAIKQIGEIKYLYKDHIKGLIDLVKCYDIPKVTDEILENSVHKAIKIAFQNN